MATVTQEQSLMSILSNLHKGRFGSITIVTEPQIKKPKTNPLNGRLKKVTQMGIRTGVDYNTIVNNRLTKEGKDKVETEKLPWGEWVIPGVVIKNKGKNYLRIYPTNNIHTTYLLDGREVNKDILKDELIEKSESNTYNLDNKVVVRTVAFDNIREINADGKIIKV
jgi:hypothetical protein